MPFEWDPSVVPIQLIRMGDKLALLALSSELTTMAGRRLRNAVRNELVQGGLLDAKEGIVSIIGLANGYSSYVTTFEEFQVQRYEGGSTLYGPHTLDAYIQEFTKLAKSMVSGDKKPPSSDIKPPDNRAHFITFVGPPKPDPKCGHGRQYGDVIDQPIETYYFSPTSNGATKTVITARFASGNPRHNRRAEGTFLLVERLIQRRTGPKAQSSLRNLDGRFYPSNIVDVEEDSDEYEWEAIANDSSFETFFKWEAPKSNDCAIATIEWHISLSPFPVQAGTYRISHLGNYKSSSSSRTKEYQGSTLPFRLVLADSDSTT